MPPPPRAPPSPLLEQRQLLNWTMCVQSLNDIRQQEANLLEVHAVSRNEDAAAKVMLHFAKQCAEIKKLENEINEHIDRHRTSKGDAEFIASIPRIAMTTVARILRYLGDIRSFNNARAPCLLPGRRVEAAHLRQLREGVAGDKQNGKLVVAGRSVYSKHVSALSRSGRTSSC